MPRTKDPVLHSDQAKDKVVEARDLVKAELDNVKKDISFLKERENVLSVRWNSLCEAAQALGAFDDD